MWVRSSHGVIFASPRFWGVALKAIVPFVLSWCWTYTTSHSVDGWPTVHVQVRMSWLVSQIRWRCSLCGNDDCAKRSRVATCPSSSAIRHVSGRETGDVASQGDATATMSCDGQVELCWCYFFLRGDLSPKWELSSPRHIRSIVWHRFTGSSCVARLMAFDGPSVLKLESLARGETITMAL